jgi:hypothetical protein
VLWSELGIVASEVWAEIDRRQALLGMAEKLPKAGKEGSVSSIEEECSEPDPIGPEKQTSSGRGGKQRRFE